MFNYTYLIIFHFSWFESNRIWAKALIVGEWCQSPSHWRQVKNLSQWLKEQGIPGIYDIDTRALTKKIRETGNILGRIVQGVPSPGPPKKFINPNTRNLVAEVSIKVY